MAPALPSLDLDPRVQHRGEDELPFLATGDGQHVQLLQVDLDQGLWVVRVRFDPGTRIARHKHTGAVLAFTIAGRWRYLEYNDVLNTAGSYLFEPAGSIHTLDVPEDNDGQTDVWFAIWGANLELADDGSVQSVLDAGTVLQGYRLVCQAMGIDDPPVVVS